jgi:hypothetical protein
MARPLSEEERATLARAWARYVAQREKNDEIRRQAGIRNAAKLAPTLRRLMERGYSLTDIGDTLGVTKQSIHEILRRAESG